jgi:hypothetical protein
MAGLALQVGNQVTPHLSDTSRLYNQQDRDCQAHQLWSWNPEDYEDRSYWAIQSQALSRSRITHLAIFKNWLYKALAPTSNSQPQA